MEIIYSIIHLLLSCLKLGSVTLSFKCRAKGKKNNNKGHSEFGEYSLDFYFTSKENTILHIKHEYVHDFYILWRLTSIL